MSSISSGDDEGSLASPKVLGRTVLFSFGFPVSNSKNPLQRRSSNESSNLSETIRNAEALVDGLDDSYSKVPEVTDENSDERPVADADQNPASTATQVQPSMPQPNPSRVGPPQGFVNGYPAVIQMQYPAANPMAYAAPPYGYYPPLANGINLYHGYNPYLYCPVPPPGVLPTVAPPVYFSGASAAAAAHVVEHSSDDDAEAVEKLLGNIEKTLNDQSSCRLVQKKLEEEPESARQTLVNKLFVKMIPKMDEYMNLPFGNYLCQKLFEMLNEKQLRMVIEKVKGAVVGVANNLHGTRSIQKLVEMGVRLQGAIGDVTELLSGHVPELVMVAIFLEG